jgi:uncharacterized protein (TIGR02996 family)
MLSVVRLAPPSKLRCGDYDLDAFVVELDGESLDFRFVLGSGLGIYWAIPAVRDDRLRLFHVDGAAYTVDEPELEADPFVFDLPRTEWTGELGALADGSAVTAVAIEVSKEPAGYRCEVVRRTPDGAEQTRTFAWAERPVAPASPLSKQGVTTEAFVDSLVDAYHRWDEPEQVARRAARDAATAQRDAEIHARSRGEAVARLGLSRYVESALAEPVQRVAAWDRRSGKALSIVVVEPGFPVQRSAVCSFGPEQRDDMDDHLRERGLRIGHAFYDAHIYWDSAPGQLAIWQEEGGCRLMRAGDVLQLFDRTVGVRDVQAVISFTNPARRNHRGLALELADGSRVLVVERADSDAAPLLRLRPEDDWAGCLGNDLATALAVPYRAGDVFATATPVSPRARAAAPRAPVLPALMDACHAALDDDAPRLAWADAVGGERGELVRLQCEIARGALPFADALAARRRVRALLDEHGAAWCGLDGLATAVRFERGFVDAAAVPAETWLARGREALEQAPLLTALTVRAISATEYSDAVETVLARLDRLLADPAARSLAALDLTGAWIEHVDDDGPNWFASLGNELMPRLVASGRLVGLRGLALPSLERDAVRALVACDLSSLEVLHIHCGSPSNEQWSMLFAPDRLPALRALAIGNPYNKGVELERILDGLPASLVDLSAKASTGLLTLLAHHPIARQLERLELSDGSLGNTDLFAAFRRLAVLDLGDTIGVLPSDLTAATMPALRELHYFSDSGADSIAAIASVMERFGAQLELLDLDGFNRWQTHGSDAAVARAVNAHRERLAGVLLQREPRHGTGLLHLGRDRRSPWWDHVILDDAPSA